MKKHANTLYVTTQGCYIAQKGECLVVYHEKKMLISIPSHTLEGVVCFGRVGMSPFAMGLCGERGISVAFLTEKGRLLSRMSGSQKGNILLRRDQFRKSESELESARIAKTFILGKIANCRTVLLRAHRDRPEIPQKDLLARASTKLEESLDSLWKNDCVDAGIIRGYEGEAAKNYFDVFDHLIVSQKEDFQFTSRTRHPPLDRVNALLSFCYALLTNDVKTACEATGLDPQMGFFHTDRSGRPSLALDLMEELRPVLADRLVLSLINRRQLNLKDFEMLESGAVMISEKGRRTILRTYQERKSETIKHPYLDEKITIGILPLIQARLLARYLRGDMDNYPVFLWK